MRANGEVIEEQFFASKFYQHYQKIIYFPNKNITLLTQIFKFLSPQDQQQHFGVRNTGSCCITKESLAIFPLMVQKKNEEEVEEEESIPQKYEFISSFNRNSIKWKKKGDI